MKKLILTLILTAFMFSAANATNLQWDLDEYHELSDGYTVYYSDATADYNKTFSADEAIVDESSGTVYYENIEENLNLHPGVEYTFTLTRFNSTNESDHSASVTWTRPAYSPPTDQLPDAVSSEPSSINGLGVE